jgi:hypothetical protein
MLRQLATHVVHANSGNEKKIMLEKPVVMLSLSNNAPMLMQRGVSKISR